MKDINTSDIENTEVSGTYTYNGIHIGQLPSVRGGCYYYTDPSKGLAMVNNREAIVTVNMGVIFRNEVGSIDGLTDNYLYSLCDKASVKFESFIDGSVRKSPSIMQSPDDDEVFLNMHLIDAMLLVRQGVVDMCSSMRLSSDTTDSLIGKMDETIRLFNATHHELATSSAESESRKIGEDHGLQIEMETVEYDRRSHRRSNRVSRRSRRVRDERPDDLQASI